MYKISFILNYAPHYREMVYRLINKTFDCRFYFGDKGNIKKIDYKIFSTPVKEFRVRSINGYWCYYVDVLSAQEM
jgi:hypothetical protein